MRTLLRDVVDALSEIVAVSRVLSSTDRFRFYKCFTKKLPAVIKERSLHSVDLCMDGNCRSLNVHSVGKRFLLACYSFCSVREIYARRIYFPQDDWLPSQGDLVFDLGANVGMVSLFCAKRGADVVAVEAQDGFIPCIEENLEKNGCRDRVHIIHGLVGGMSGVFSSTENFEHADHYRGELPKAISIDDLLEIYPGRKIHLIKMDIEGSEFDLFSGDAAWLSNVRRIAMEVHSSFGDPDVIITGLKSHGFQVVLCDERGHQVSALGNVGDNGLIFATR